MKALRFMPYMLLIFLIFASTFISMLKKISFYLYLRRTALFLLIIFIASKIFIDNIPSLKEQMNSTLADHKYNAIKDSEIKIDQDEKDEFTPLDFREYEKDKTSF